MEFNRINNKTGNKTQAFQSYSIVYQLKEETQNDKLFTAVSEGDLNTIKSLLTKNLGLIEAKNKFGSSPLHYATWWGQLPLVEYLVEQGADLNTKDIFDQTLVHAAAWNGDLKLVKFFFVKGLSLEEKDQKGNTPLLSAAKNNHLKVVKFLISEGADSAVQDNEGDNVFLIAAKNGYLKIIDFFAHDMKNKKIDLSTIKDANNNTLLHLAAANDHIKLLKYLVYFHDFDLEAKNNDGNTPLDIALEMENNNLVENLIQLGAKVDAAKFEGNIRVHPIYSTKLEELGRYVLKQNEDLFANTSLSQKKVKRLKKTHHYSKPSATTTPQNNVFDMQSLNASLNPLASSTGFFQHHVQAPQAQVSPFNLSSISNVEGGMNSFNSTGVIALAQALFTKPRKNQKDNLGQIERYEQQEQIISAINTFDANNFTSKP